MNSLLKPLVLAKANDKTCKLSFWSRLANFWDSLLVKLVKQPELKVWCSCDRWGHIWWSAFDPTTGRSIYNISEEQMRVWIEQRYR